MLVVSFYTVNGSYPALAARLRASCERFGLRHKIVEAPQRESWKDAINMKAGFILQSLLDERGPVLWLDCDCEVRKRPTLLMSGLMLPGSPDFAVYNWRTTDHDYDESEITNSGGVSYWNYTAPAIELLVRWQVACSQHPACVDDQTLDAVWKKFRPPVRAMWLPKTYNWMWSTESRDQVIDTAFGPVPDDVVIWHDYVGGKHWNG